MEKRLFLIVGFVLINLVYAEDYYIRTGATGAGDGTSWSDAFPDFASVLWERGNTYYVAGGIYPESPTISVRESGSTWVLVKKATQSDHGSETGWSESFAGVAQIDGKLSISNGFIEIDGQTGSGTTGHGFKLYSFDTPPSISAVLFISPSASPVYISHIEIEGPGFDYGDVGSDGLYWNAGSGAKGLHISNCYIHEIPRNGVSVGEAKGTSYDDYGLLFENCVVERTGGVGIEYPGIHGQGMQIGYSRTTNYTIIRNSIFKDIIGTGSIVYLTGNHYNVQVYNNIFYSTDNSAYATLSPGWLVSYGNGDFFHVYHNTIYNLNASAVYGRIFLDSAGIKTAEARNNFWHSSRLPYGGFMHGITESSNNGFYGNFDSSNPGDTESSSPFMDVSEGDFRLRPEADAVDAGYDLSGIVDEDYAGISRSQGLGWDIGAYEFAGCISLGAADIMDMINAWRAGTIDIKELMEGIQQWKNGCS